MANVAIWSFPVNEEYMSMFVSLGICGWEWAKDSSQKDEYGGKKMTELSMWLKKCFI